MNPEDRIRHIVDRCNRSISNMFAAPSMWGSSEALELQFVTVLEMREEANGTNVPVRNLYRELLKKNFNTAKFPAAEHFANEQGYASLLTFLRQLLVVVDSGGKDVSN